MIFTLSFQRFLLDVFQMRKIVWNSTMKIMALIITAARLALGMYWNVGVKTPSDRRISAPVFTYNGSSIFQIISLKTTIACNVSQ